MVFSSPVFLFLFLPIVLGVYFVCPTRLRNVWLTVASLFFYVWGAKTLTTVMLISIGGNYLLGRAIDAAQGKKRAHWLLGLTVLLNLGLLCYFKYAEFLLGWLQPLAVRLGVELPRLSAIELPLGISFFTFHAMSYVIDVYRGECRAQRKLSDLGLYICLFPQLVAGPILRYKDVAGQIAQRRITREGFAEGVRRFLIGLGKKLLIANSVAPVADAVFDIPSSELTASVAWLGVLCYTVQIYFDFSGYSDMAIGLGHMLGFRFLENFNYPYVARSMADFWRRWHISLSTWFRDYLYIPLGGNRVGRLRMYCNLVVVFLLCGLWHGASLSFAVWGLYHGLFLVLEKQSWARRITTLGPLAWLYTIVAVMVGWVFFRANDLSHAGDVLRAMAGLGAHSSLEYHLDLYLDTGLLLVLAAAAIGSTPWMPAVDQWLQKRRHSWQQAGTLWPEAALACGRIAGLATLLFASAVMMSASTYNPFIYFRF